ncbi:MAG TPA: outer membrane protein transport protein [bacterium]|nr:outer membrane protein transport protein [bacterium]HPQ66148.1 outer membrane protein transport protein [bacterium]
MAAKRVVFAAAALIGLALAVPGTGRAGGYENFGLGARAQSMGGAFIAVADDWTAGYWNPAGLGRTGGQFGADLLFVQPTVRSSGSYANFTPDRAAASYKWTKDVFVDYTGMEPDRFTKYSTSGNYLNPQGLGISYLIPEVATVGLTIYQPLGYAIDWSENMPYLAGSIYGSNWQRLISTSFQLSAARQIVPGVYFGAGVALLIDDIRRDAEKIVDSVPGPSPLDYTYDITVDDDGVGCEGSFGLLVDIADWISLGGVLRTGASVRLTGDADASLSLLGLQERSDLTQKFRHPPTWGVGIAVRPLPGLLCSLDMNQSLWDTFRTDIDFDDPGVLLRDENYNEDWHNAEKIRVGCEYLLASCWKVRGGFCYDESPMPAKSVSLAYIPDTDKKYVTLGLGWEPPGGWAFDLLAATAWGDRHAQGEKFEQRIVGLGLDVSYRF